MSRPIPTLATLVAGAVVALATCGAGLRKDEFLCEEAHAKLKECCPGFTTTDLDYYHPTRPDVATPASRPR